jgi:hypothetical protein
MPTLHIGVACSGFSVTESNEKKRNGRKEKRKKDRIMYVIKTNKE